MAYKICQGRLKSTPNTKFTLKELPKTLKILPKWRNVALGSGCGSVVRAVTSNSRGPRFKSSHWQKFIEHLLSTVLKRRKYKKKRPGIAHFQNDNVTVAFSEGLLVTANLLASHFFETKGVKFDTSKRYCNDSNQIIAIAPVCPIWCVHTRKMVGLLFVPISVTRLGEISPLGQTFKNL